MHQPETWGYVQFTRGSIDSVEFRPDSSFQVRAVLMKIYHTQQKHRAQTGRYARTMEELGLADVSLPGSARLTLLHTTDGWSARVDLSGTEWTVSEDSRLTRYDRLEP